MTVRFCLILIAAYMLSMALAAPSHAAWQTIVMNSPDYPHTLYGASTTSVSDPSVFLVVACQQGQRNATVSIETSNSILGNPGDYERAYFTVGKGSPGSSPSGTSEANGRISEEGIGFYLATQQQGIAVNAMIFNNDWMSVIWSFAAPSRGKLMTQLFGKPTHKPQRNYTFDLRGYREATREMAAACQW